MGLPKEHREATCKMDAEMDSSLRDRLPSIAEKIIENCTDTGCFTHVDFEPIPSKQSVIDIIEKLREVIFPGYFNREKLDPVNLKYGANRFGSLRPDLRTGGSQHPSRLLSLRQTLQRVPQPRSRGGLGAARRDPGDP
jgi:hypothetical protein